MELPILYQDEMIVAVNKPAGLLVHRSMIDKHETQFAMQIVRDQIGQHVFPVHRLDKPTSGVLMFALSAATARILTEQFAQQQVSKSYIAIVRGYLKGQDTIDYALKEKLDKIADKKADKDKPAQEAVTRYQALQHVELPHGVGRYPTARYSLVALKPETGRKHQLRRHMAHVRHPIVGDTTHGDGKHNKFVKSTYDFQGLALSCIRLEIVHPGSQKPLVINSEFDPRIASLLSQWDLDTQQIIQQEQDLQW